MSILKFFVKRKDTPLLPYETKTRAHPDHGRRQLESPTASSRRGTLTKASQKGKPRGRCGGCESESFWDLLGRIGINKLPPPFQICPS